MITQKYVKELFDYHEDGYLTWKDDRNNRVKKGDKAGGLNSRGYYLVHFEGKSYRLHRLIWLYHYGYLPENFIDHIDRNTQNNKIDNLREVSNQCNIRNSKDFCSNSSGIRGVSFNNSRNKWQSQIKISNKLYYLGEYKNFSDAVCARLAAEQCLNWNFCDFSSNAYKYVCKNVQKRIIDI